MLSTQDEQIIISYIMNALEYTEEKEVSSRLSRDETFRCYYRRILKSLQPILSSRLNEEEETQIRKEAKGLASRTMCFLRGSSEKSPQVVIETTEQMIETVADTRVETKVVKPLETQLEPEFH